MPDALSAPDMVCLPNELDLHAGREGLECLIAGRRVLVPLDEVKRVVELDVDMPPPLASTWVSGLGLLDGRIAFSVSLFWQPRRSERRRVLGIELRASSRGEVRWVIEVGQVLSRVRGLGIGERAEAGHRWLVPVRSDDDERAWLDVAAMRAELFKCAAH